MQDYVSFAVDNGVAETRQGRASPPLSPAMREDLRSRFPHAIVLRVDLSGDAGQEAMVARILLQSAASSVQLHDL